MRVQMSCDARASRLAQVEAKVHPLMTIDRPKNALYLLGEFNHLQRLFRAKRGERVNMAIRNQENMPRRVRKGIQAEKAGRAPRDQVHGPFGILPAVIPWAMA